MTKTSATETTKKRAGVRRSARLAAKAKPPETPKKRVVVRKSVRPEPSGTQKKSSRTKKSTEPIPEDLEIFVEATRIRSRAVPGIEDFQSSGILASGGFGNIYLVEKIGGIDNGKTYAMKQVDKIQQILAGKHRAQYLRNEREVLEKISNAGSPFLLQMHYAFDDQIHVYFVTDLYLGGSLFDHILRMGHLPDIQDIKLYVAEIVLALERLHALGIIYNGLKLENIVLNDHGHIVLIDFGSAKHEADDETEGHIPVSERIVEIEYAAPELVTDGQKFDTRIDIWALGIVLYELIEGNTPFKLTSKLKYNANAPNKTIIGHIRNSEIQCPPFGGDPPMSKTTWDLITKLLVKNPNQRITIPDIKKHAFFRGMKWDQVNRQEIVPVFQPEVDPTNFRKYFKGKQKPVPIRQTEKRQYIINSGKHFFRGFPYSST